MSTLQTEKTVRAWHRRGKICVKLSSGRTVEFPVSHNSRLSGAAHIELNHIEISPFGLHWPDLDEDLSTAGLIAGRYGNTHGGRRPGAGRKPADHVRMQLSVKPEIREEIEKFAATHAFTLSEAVEKMVDTSVGKRGGIKRKRREPFVAEKPAGKRMPPNVTRIRTALKKTAPTKEKIWA